MEVMDVCEIFLWPVINGKEYEVSYCIELTDYESASRDEPGYENWELQDNTAILEQYNDPVQLWVPDGYIEKICQKHFDLGH
jgi:hypothetical protein